MFISPVPNSYSYSAKHQRCTINPKAEKTSTMLKMMISMAKHRMQTVKPLTLVSLLILQRRSVYTATEDGDSRLYTQLLESSSIDKTMGQWLNEGEPVNGDQLSRLIWKLTSKRSFNTALESGKTVYAMVNFSIQQLTDWMENKGIKMNVSCLARRVNLTSKIRGIDMADKLFHDLPENAKNEKTYGALLNAYCHSKMEDKAVALFEEMKKLKYVAYSVCYNSMMTLYRELDKPQVVFEYYNEMRAAKVLPDKLTRDFLCYLAMNNIISIDKVIQELKLAKFGFSAIYFEMASYYNSNCAFEKTLSTLKKAEQVMDKKQRQPFYFLISLYAGAGDISETIRAWKSLKTAFDKLTNTCYYNFLKALELLDDVDGMKQCFKEWESQCSRYDERIRTLMVDAYLKRGREKEAKSLKMKKIKAVVADSTQSVSDTTV